MEILKHMEPDLLTFQNIGMVVSYHKNPTFLKNIKLKNRHRRYSVRHAAHYKYINLNSKLENL